MKFAEFDQYSEDLLMAQYDVSEIISHELMKGEIREDFLISTLESCSEPKPYFVKGTLSDGIDDAGQLDIILSRPHSHLRRLGTQCLISKDDALCVIEVKGNCTGTDLRKSAEKAVTTRNLRGQTTPIYGVACYKVALELKTIMNRFGYSFDRNNNTYFDNATIPKEAEADWREIEYPDLDFFVSLEDGKKVLLRKYELTPGKFRFVRSIHTPLIKEVFSMIRGLWVPANQGVRMGTGIDILIFMILLVGYSNRYATETKIDAAGELHHIIMSGIEPRNIFYTARNETQKDRITYVNKSIPVPKFYTLARV